MEKMVWSAPKANVEQFAADEYCIAVCVYLGCDWAQGNGKDPWGENHTGANGGSGCGNQKNQMFKYLGKDADGNYRYAIFEINNGVYSDLQCYLFTSQEDQLKDKNGWGSDYQSTGSTELVFKDQSELLEMDKIYWNTNTSYIGGYYDWMKHQGTINLQNQQHINRS